MQEVHLRTPIRINQGDKIEVLLLGKYGNTEGFEPILQPHVDHVLFWGMKKK